MVRDRLAVARRDVLLRQSEKALVRFAASEPFWEPAKGRAKRRAKHRTKDRAKHGPKLRDKHRDKHRPKAGRGAKKRSG